MIDREKEIAESERTPPPGKSRAATDADDSLMDRFEQRGLSRFSARDAIKVIVICILLLIVFSGASVREQGEEMRPGIGRDLVLAFGKPAGWVADRLPFDEAAHDATAWLSPDVDLGEGGFDDAVAQNGADVAGGGGEVPPVLPSYFDPAELGEDPPPKEPLENLLVTGDSLSTPLDLELARKLADEGLLVDRDPHVGTGISNDVLVDWGQLSTSQVKQFEPDAVVVFIGANEGYPLPGPGGKDVDCCSPEWAASFANRVRLMMNTYRQGDTAKVYWLTVMTARDPARARITHAVNEALEVAAQPWRDQVRLVDMVSVFTPGERYRDSMDIDGEEQIVRESDGIHLNEVASGLAADIVIEAIGRDFTY